MISYRLRASEHAAIQPFIETFVDRQGHPSVSTAFRWLLSRPGVIDAMNERIADKTKRAS